MKGREREREERTSYRQTSHGEDGAAGSKSPEEGQNTEALTSAEASQICLLSGTLPLSWPRLRFLM